MSAGVEIEVWDWRDRIPVRSAFNELNPAIHHLLASGPADISVSRSGEAIVAGGRGGRFVLTFTPNKGIDNWHAETLQPPSEKPLQDLVVGGQTADYPARYRLTKQELETALRWFVTNGGMSDELHWTRD